MRADGLHSARFGWVELSCRAVTEPFGNFTAGVLLSGRVAGVAGRQQLDLRRDDVVRCSITAANEQPPTPATTGALPLKTQGRTLS